MTAALGSTAMTGRQASVLVIHVACSLFMTGLIWFVQVVHYPLFSAVGTDGFSHYAIAHSARTSWVVAPVMLVEMATAIALVASPSPALTRRIALTGLALLVVIWISTALVQVPRHELLSSGYDPHTVRALVVTNWIRTCSWTLRSILLLTALGRSLRSAFHPA